MDGIFRHIKNCVFFALCFAQLAPLRAQNTVAFDISQGNAESKRVFLFNTSLITDSIHLKNNSGKNLSPQSVSATEYQHSLSPEIQLYESDGSGLFIDTAGNFFMRDIEKPDAKNISLGINIDTLGIGTQNLVIECTNRSLENLEVFVIPFGSYKVSSVFPNVSTKLAFRLEDIIYGAKGKIPPRLMDLWKDQVQIDPADRKILYDFKLILPKEMVKRCKATLMVYDLSYQVVAIYPDISKPVTIIKRDNIMSGTYVYKLYVNGEEEVKKGLLHYLSPEDEQKKLEQTNQQPQD